MKKLILAFIGLGTLTAYCQQKTEYYDGNWKRTDDKSQMVYYRIIEYTGPTTCKGPIVYYYANGVKQSEAGASYVDPVTEANDKLEGSAFWYDKNGKLTQWSFFENGSRVADLSGDTYLNTKFKPGDKVDYLAQSGDQDIWIPAEVLFMRGSDAYRLKPLLYGWGEITDTYESYLRPSAPTSIKLILPTGTSEPNAENMAKSELMKIHSDATILQTVMNGNTWEITKDYLNVPEYRQKAGYVVYKFGGNCYTMRFIYTEDYSGGTYQKSTGQISLETETPYVCN